MSFGSQKISFGTLRRQREVDGVRTLAAFEIVEIRKPVHWTNIIIISVPLSILVVQALIAGVRREQLESFIIVIAMIIFIVHLTDTQTGYHHRLGS